MSFFVLRFSSRRGHEPVIERFETSAAALERLLEEERRLEGTDEGVVLLVAEDEADLLETHAHYFRSFGALRDAAEAEEAVG
jgi:hypothetical protein